MKINIYPIKSDLRHDQLINSDSMKLINEIQSNLKCDINFSELDNFYDSDLSLILVQTGGSEGKFLQIIDKLVPPIYLLTYGSNNSLAASLEILSYLKKHNLSGEVLHGDPNYISSRIKRLSMNKKYFGIIGKPSDWLISSDVDYGKVESIFNIKLIDISIDELVDYYNKENDVISTNYEFNQNEISKALRLNNAIEQIITKYNLSGLTIRCFDLLTKLETTSCLSLALLNKKGIISACEGDIPSLITMSVIKDVTNEVSFQCNPSYIDIKSNTIILAHCTLPLSMCTSYKLDTHFESGIGIGIKGELKICRITLIKISSDLKHYFISEGEIIENLNRHDLCRSQIKIHLDKSVSYFLTAPLGNHHLICYGEHGKELERYLSSIGLESII